MVKGIGHAAFNVKDMDKTIAFYEETLGFKRAFDIQLMQLGEDSPQNKFAKAMEGKM